ALDVIAWNCLVQTKAVPRMQVDLSTYASRCVVRNNGRVDDGMDAIALARVHQPSTRIFGVTDMPTRSLAAMVCPGLTRIRTGSRCTILVKFPVALWGATAE